MGAHIGGRMKRNEAITTIMTSDLQTVHVGQKLSEVRALLSEKSFNHVPVVSGKTLVGMISATDMVRLSLSTYGVDQRAVDALLDSQHSVESVMTKVLDTLAPSATVRDAAQKLAGAPFHSLPVVDNGELKGLVTSTDIIKYLLEQY